MIGRPKKYPWDLPEFFIPNVNQGYMRRAGKLYARRNGGAYKARTVTENGVKGVRVWRIA